MVLDPGHAKTVLAGLQQHGLQCEPILVTHHRADPAGGLDDRPFDAGTTPDEVSVFAAIRQ
ncbi:MAG: hypothetical protein ABI907_08920 [Ramlibacter sp.]